MDIKYNTCKFIYIYIYNNTYSIKKLDTWYVECHFVGISLYLHHLFGIQ